jgi:hypothetical protein
LRQVGIGFRLWANDNEEKFPWFVDPAQGGSLGSGDWTDNYRACSNAFATPKVLICPTDKEKTVEINWTVLDGDRHISYFVGLDAQETKPQTILAGDRNVYGGGGGLDPSWNPGMASSIDAAWLNTMHMNEGNLGLSDGSVQATKTTQLREQLSSAMANGSTNVVFSLPRGVL